MWIDLAELIANESEVCKSLQAIGAVVLTQHAKTALKRQVEETNTIGEALVATQPGYVSPTLYVHPNGDVTDD